MEDLRILTDHNFYVQGLLIYPAACTVPEPWAQVSKRSPGWLLRVRCMMRSVQMKACTLPLWHWARPEPAWPSDAEVPEVLGKEQSMHTTDVAMHELPLISQDITVLAAVIGAGNTGAMQSNVKGGCMQILMPGGLCVPSSTMRFGKFAKVLAECILMYYRTSE